VEPRIETVCAQAREDLPSVNRPLVAPIYQSAVWAIDSADQCDAIYAGEEEGFIYTRDANPNHRALERVVARLEAAEDAVVFGTGMAALAASITTLTRSGGRVLASNQLYGATTRLLLDELSRFDVTIELLDTQDLNAVAAALERPADLLVVETITNPLIDVEDIPALAVLCHDAGARLVVDNTFAPPPCCRPLALGADLVVHSVTKFLGGHSDLTLGVAAGPAALTEGLRKTARLWGGAANPFECWLALRGISTLPLRMERSCENAAELARRLDEHPEVRRVNFPILDSPPKHDVAERILTAPGSMLSFELESGTRARDALRSLRHVRFAPSLGDVATTISYPWITSHRGLTPAEREAIGIREGLLRLSVGIDHVEDVWTDFEIALELD
jgi:cystathionine beta-lyase/cystathionine gamma-synthase